MPYIREAKKRMELNEWVGCLVSAIGSDGELNYAIMRLIMCYFNIPENESYEKYERIDGLLECIKHEISRRFKDPYEDKKMEENGDII